LRATKNKNKRITYNKIFINLKHWLLFLITLY
jgi:hypothetical protein